MLTNGNFETGALSPWTHHSDGGGTASITGDAADGTSNAALCVHQNGSLSQLRQAGLSITSGTMYEISLWAKSEFSDGIELLLLDNTTTSTLATFSFQPLSGTYAQYTQTATAIATSADARLVIGFSGFPNQDFFIDEVVFDVVTQTGHTESTKIGLEIGLRHGVS